MIAPPLDREEAHDGIPLVREPAGLAVQIEIVVVTVVAQSCLVVR